MAISLCQSGSNPFLAKYFHDCIYSQRDMVGFTAGLLSILCWLIAQLPQFITNIKNQSADALSPWFLAEWLLGDTFNLIGCLLQGEQLPTQLYTAMYFVAADVVLILQYIYYSALQRRKERMFELRRQRQLLDHSRHLLRHPAASLYFSEGPKPVAEPNQPAEQAGPGDGSRPRGNLLPAVSKYRAMAAVSMLAMLHCQLQPGPWQHAVNSIGDWAGSSLSARAGEPMDAAWSSGRGGGTQQHRVLLQAVSAVGQQSSHHHQRHRPEWTKTTGTVIGYASMLFYWGSRVSQISKNWRRKSADGLAMGMFCCAILANLLYGAGILIRCYRVSDVVTSLPWLLGSLGTVGLDITIFAQSRVYAPKAGMRNPVLAEVLLDQS